MISRPTDEPMVRATLLAAVCTRPSVFPPRGPVRPNSMSFSPPPNNPPPVWADASGAPAGGVGCAEAGAPWTDARSYS